MVNTSYSARAYALANKGHDTRALQAYLGVRNIQLTVRYTEFAPAIFAQAVGNVGGEMGLSDTFQGPSAELENHRNGVTTRFLLELTRTGRGLRI